MLRNQMVRQEMLRWIPGNSRKLWFGLGRRLIVGGLGAVEKERGYRGNRQLKQRAIVQLGGRDDI